VTNGCTDEQTDGKKEGNTGIKAEIVV